MTLEVTFLYAGFEKGMISLVGMPQSVGHEVLAGARCRSCSCKRQGSQSPEASGCSFA